MIIADNPIEYIDPLAFDGIIELKSLHFVNTLRHAPDLSKTGHSLRFKFLSNVEVGNKSIDLKSLIILEELTFCCSGLNEVPKSIRHVSSTIHELNLADNCITTLENMENIVFRIYVSHEKLHLSPESYVFTTASIDIYDFIWKPSHPFEWFEYLSMGRSLPKKREYCAIFGLYPWHCNGSMLWLQHSLCNGPWPKSAFYIRQPQGLVIDTSQLVCHSPVEFRGRALLTLNESALNKLDSCPKGEYNSIVGLSVRWFCVVYESPTESLTRYEIK